MKIGFKIYILFFSVIFSTSAFSQSLSFFDLNIENYPEISAKFYALQENGNTINGLEISDFKLTENGAERQILDISCPAVKPPEAISSVLTIDVSGSMSNKGLNYAKAAANAWLDVIPLGKSECALTTFNSQNFLNMDFSTERSELKEAVKELEAGGGTDFNAGFIDPMSGALLVSEKAKHKKVIVFLTDGHAGGDESKIIKKANELNATIYCVVLGNPAPKILKNVSLQTGGNYYEEITTEQEAKEVYLNILQNAQGGEPCTIRWLSDGCDLERRAEIQLLQYSLGESLDYTIHREFLSTLEVTPSNSIRFGGVEPEKTERIIITIKALNKDIHIEDITSSNELFDLSNYSGVSFTIEQGKSYDFFLDFTPVDSSYTFSRFDIKSDACFGKFFYVSGGFPYSNIGDQTLKLIRPNGGEYFPAGGIEEITWEGVLPSDTMKLEYSIDSGKNWNIVTEEASDLKYEWKVPNTPSNECLMRVSQFTPAETRSQVIDGKMENVASISWDPQGNRIVYDGRDRLIKIVQATTGEILHEIDSYLHYNQVAWNPKSDVIAISQSDFYIRLLDPETGQTTKTIGNHEKWIPALDWHPDGIILASGGNDEKIKIWNTTNKQLIKEFDAGGAIFDLEWNYDGSLLASAGTSQEIKIWDAASGNLLKTLKGHTSNVTSITWSPFGNRLASGSEDNTLKIWDIESEETIHDINTGSTVNDVVWSLEGLQIATAQDDATILIWDPETGKKINTLSGHTAPVQTLAWRPDGSRLASGSDDNTIRIWYFNFIMQEDESDDLWNITLPVIASQDIDMGILRTGSIKDSIISGFIDNIGNVDVEIDSIKISGDDKEDFHLVSGIPPFSILPGETHDVEFRFKPASIGKKQADIAIYSQNDTLIQNISGEAVEPAINLITDIVDFGQVGVTFAKDTLAMLIENTGNDDIEISEIKLQGPDTTSFVLLDEIDDFILEAGERRSFMLRFMPMDSGRTNGRITFYYDDETSPVSAQLFGEGITVCGVGSFYYPNFRYLKDLEFAGKARRVNNMILITPSRGNETGAVWHNKLVPIREGFVMDFSFLMTDGDAGNSDETSLPGADGIAFVIQNSSPDTIGLSGGGIGYQSISNSIAVEFDTFANDSTQIEDFKDPNGNHVAVQSRGTSKNSGKHFPENTYAINPDIILLRTDSTRYYVKIDYKQEGESFRVFLDTNEIESDTEPVINIEDFDITQIIDLIGGNRSYIGITGATGSAWEKHYLVDWKYCPEYDEHFISVPYISPIRDNKELLKVFPNPGKGRFTFELNIQEAQYVDLRLYDIYGREIASVYEGDISSGNNRFVWNSAGLTDGTYICRFVSGDIVESFKLIILE